MYLKIECAYLRIFNVGRPSVGEAWKVGGRCGGQSCSSLRLRCFPHDRMVLAPTRTRHLKINMTKFTTAAE